MGYKLGKLTCAKSSLANALSLLLLTWFFSSLPAFGQQIISDGNTNTLLEVKNNTTNITTTTIKGNNAFNSFQKFNVDSGNTVNLVVPAQSENLINLVHSEATKIDGILNSIKNNQIGGNVFLVNPYGVTICPQGVINVGKLTTVTPTVDYLEGFFASPGNPDDGSVNVLLNGTAPVNAGATIEIQGQINALEGVKLDAGTIVNSGIIRSGASAMGPVIEAQDLLNVGDLVSEENLQLEYNQITLKAQENITHSGKIYTDGTDNTSAGNINMTAGGDITLEENSLISSKGRGENSNAGDIYIFADHDSTFKRNAVIDARGGDVSGDGGFIELSAKNLVTLDGGIVLANVVDGLKGEFLIDPLDIYAGDALSDGIDITLSAGDSIVVQPAAYISSRNLITSATGEDVSAIDHYTAPSMGDSANISLDAPVITVSAGSNILSFADNGFNSGEVDVLTDDLQLFGSIDAGDAMVKLRLNTAGPLIISGTGYTSSAEINSITAGTIQIGNDGVETTTTQIDISESPLTLTSNLVLNATGDINVLQNITANNLAVNSGQITWINNTTLTTSGNINIYAGNRVEIGSFSSLIAGSDIMVEGVDYGANTEIDLQLASIQAGGNITFVSNSANSNMFFQDSNIEADGNITIAASGTSGQFITFDGATFISNSGAVIVNTDASVEFYVINSFNSSSGTIFNLTGSGFTINIASSFDVTGDLEITADSFNLITGSSLNCCGGNLTVNAPTIDLNGDIWSNTLYGTGLRYLLIDPGGTINGSSTIAATPTATEVIIDSTYVGGAGGDINLNGTVTGAGNIFFDAGMGGIQISNQSPLNLVINDLIVYNDYPGKLIINAVDQTSGYGALTITSSYVNQTLDPMLGMIQIFNAIAGVDTQILGYVYNAYGAEGDLIQRLIINSGGTIDQISNINATFSAGTWDVDSFWANGLIGSIEIMTDTLSGTGTLETHGGLGGIEIICNDSANSLTLHDLDLIDLPGSILINGQPIDQDIGSITVIRGTSPGTGDISVTQVANDIIVAGTIDNCYGSIIWSNRILQVDAGGTIQPPSNIDATDTGSSIIVHDTTAGGSSGNIDLVANNVTGTGSVHTYLGTGGIFIENLSNKDLEINDLTLIEGTPGQFTVNGSAVTAAIYNGITVNIGDGQFSSKGKIIIENTGGGDTIINGHINNTYGTAGDLIQRLIINADESINPISTMTVSISPVDVSVDNFIADSTVGGISISTGGGIVIGTGILETHGGQGGINIVNNVNNPLFINALALTGYPGGIRIDTMDLYQDYGSITVIRGINYALGDIVIDNNGGMDLAINSNVINSYGDSAEIDGYLHIDSAGNFTFPSPSNIWAAVGAGIATVSDFVAGCSSGNIYLNSVSISGGGVLETAGGVGGIEIWNQSPNDLNINNLHVVDGIPGSIHYNGIEQIANIGTITVNIGSGASLIAGNIVINNDDPTSNLIISGDVINEYGSNTNLTYIYNINSVGMLSSDTNMSAMVNPSDITFNNLYASYNYAGGIFINAANISGTGSLQTTGGIGGVKITSDYPGHDLIINDIMISGIPGTITINGDQVNQDYNGISVVSGVRQQIADITILNNAGTNTIINGFLTNEYGNPGNSYEWLSIDNFGNPSPFSTISTNVFPGQIEVLDTIAGGTGGNIIITGNVSGVGTIETFGGKGTIEINNYSSTHDLLINDLTIRNGTPGRIYINDIPITALNYNGITVNAAFDNPGGIWIGNLGNTNTIINGNIIAESDSSGPLQRTLIVNSGSVIDPLSNIPVSISGGEIFVSEVYTGGSSNDIYITGIVSGSGTIKLAGGIGGIDITNNSADSLNIHTLVAKSGKPGRLFINDEVITSDYNGITVSIGDSSPGNGDINIVDNSQVIYFMEAYLYSDHNINVSAVIDNIIVYESEIFADNQISMYFGNTLNLTGSNIITSGLSTELNNPSGNIIFTPAATLQVYNDLNINAFDVNLHTGSSLYLNAPAVINVNSINIDGSIESFTDGVSGQKTLLVNADGSINGFSNISVYSTATEIYVDEVISGKQGLNLNITGAVTGSGILQSVRYTGGIDITNNSTKTLIFYNDLSVISGPAGSIVINSVPIVANYGSITVNFIDDTSGTGNMIIDSPNAGVYFNNTSIGSDNSISINSYDLSAWNSGFHAMTDFTANATNMFWLYYSNIYSGLDITLSTDLASVMDLTLQKSMIESGQNIYLTAPTLNIYHTVIDAAGGIQTNSSNITYFADSYLTSIQGIDIFSNSSINMSTINQFSDNDGIIISASGDITFVSGSETHFESASMSELSTSLFNLSTDASIFSDSMLQIWSVLINIDGLLSTVNPDAEYVKTLLIDAGGTINPVSNINATASAGFYDVEDVIAGAIGHDIYLYGPLSGSGTIKTSGGPGEINITNNTPTEDLYINDLLLFGVTGLLYVEDQQVSGSVGSINVITGDTAGSGDITINSSLTDVFIFGNVVNDFSNGNSVPKLLLINPDGSVNPVSNIDLFFSDASQFTVNEVASGGSSGNIDITATNVSGTGSVFVGGNTGEINITNNSLKTMNLFELNIYNYSSGSFIVNATSISSNYNGINVVIGNTPGSGDINITGNSVADINFLSNIYCNAGTLTIANAGGNIFNPSASAILNANNIQLSAINGAIGTGITPILVNLNTGILDAFAGNDIFITSPMSDLRVDSIISSAGSIILTTTGDNLNLTGATLSAHNIGLSSGNNLTIDNSTITSLQNIDMMAINILQVLNNSTLNAGNALNISSLASEAGFYEIDIIDSTLSCSGALQLLATQPDGDVYVSNSIINTVTGLTATASNNIYIDQIAGDLYLNNITGENIFIRNNDTLPADIIINAGYSVTATGSGDCLVITTENGNFINNAGATALSATTGRWLVYTANPADTIENGLTYNKMYNKTYAANPPATIGAGDYMLYSIAPTLTFTAENKNREYGEANPLFTYIVTGLIDSDLEGDALTGLPSITCVADEFSNVAGSPYLIDIEQGALSLTALGYQFDSFVDGNLTIDPATFTVTVNDYSIEYGDANPVAGDLSVAITGYKNSDTIAVVSGTTTYDLTGLPAVGSDTGTYTNVLNATGGLSATNYTFTYVDGDLTIDPAVLTVTVNDYNIEYGDANTVAGNMSVVITGYKNSDTIAVVSGTTTYDLTGLPAVGSDTGTYTNVLNATGGLSATNYTFTYVDGDLTIDPAVLTVRVNDYNIEYGDANPTAGNMSVVITGYKNSDTIVVVSGTTTYDLTGLPAVGSNTGTYTNVLNATGGLSATNYTFTYVDGALTIDPATLTVTVNDYSIEYGDANPVAGNMSVVITGYKNSDTIAVVSGTTTYDLTGLPAVGSNTGTYTNVLNATGGLSAINYTFNYLSGNLIINSPASEIPELPADNDPPPDTTTPIIPIEDTVIEQITEDIIETTVETVVNDSGDLLYLNNEGQLFLFDNNTNNVLLVSGSDDNVLFKDIADDFIGDNFSNLIETFTDLLTFGGDELLIPDSFDSLDFTISNFSIDEISSDDNSFTNAAYDDTSNNFLSGDFFSNGNGSHNGSSLSGRAILKALDNSDDNPISSANWSMVGSFLTICNSNQNCDDTDLQTTSEMLFHSINYNESNELKADETGTTFMSQCQYHPSGLLGFLTTLDLIETRGKNEFTEYGQKNTSLFTYRHPKTSKRIDVIKKVINDQNLENAERKIVNSKLYKKFLRDNKIDITQ